MKNVSNKICRQIRNMHFMFSTFLLLSCTVFKIIDPMRWYVYISEFLHSAVSEVSQLHWKFGLFVFFYYALCCFPFISMDNLKYTIYILCVKIKNRADFVKPLKAWAISWCKSCIYGYLNFTYTRVKIACTELK
jgi:hypothetical protein